MITEDYVSFETAKLLKDKGFEGENRDWYNMEGFIEEVGVDDGIDPTAHEDIFNNIIPAPTLQMTMKWLREVHHLTVDVFHFRYWKVIIKTIPDDYFKADYDYPELKPAETYEQACESGIKYCLEKLI